MGIYRTKPEEIEAVQFSGGNDSPFVGSIPAWVWSSFSRGNLSFTAHGMRIEYNGLTEDVAPGDWLVLHSDGIIRTCSHKVFQRHYTPFRKRRSKAEIDAYNATIATAAAATKSASKMVEVPLTLLDGTPLSTEMVAEMEAKVEEWLKQDGAPPSSSQAYGVAI
jgi:hypothetical protein